LNRRNHTLRGNQRGGGTMKAVLYTAVLVVGIFIAVRIVPAYVAKYQMNDKIEEQARFAVVNRWTEEQIRDNLFKVIQDLDIPATREDIKVSNTNHGILISLSYVVPVDFYIYKTDLNFTCSSEGRDIMK
jgi:cell division protein FtsL